MSLKQTIELTREAWRRGEAELAEMESQWRKAGAVCCPGCMFPSRFIQLATKQERRLAFIGQASDYVAQHAKDGLR